VTPVKLLFDEDVDARILRGLRRANRSVDARSAPEAGLARTPDREVLAQAAADGRVLVTQDVHTMTAEHADYVASGNISAGVAFIPREVSIGQAIDDLLLIATASSAEDWTNRIEFLPL
jgi:hypothetical protein